MDPHPPCHEGGPPLTLHPGPEHVRAKLTRDLTRRAAPVNTIKIHKFPEIIVTVGNLTRFHGTSVKWQLNLTG